MSSSSSSTAQQKLQQQEQPQYLEPSQLGTKEYWDNVYANSLEHLSDKRRRRKTANDDDEKHRLSSANKKAEEEADENDDFGSDNDDDDDDDDNDDNDSDPGTSWFTEHNAPEKVLDFLCSPDFPLSPENSTAATTSILDLGTGNGTMLALLRREGEFTGPMVGVDYSLPSIELARRLHADDDDIRFEVWDVFDTSKRVEEHDWFPRDKQGFDIVLDKGTFDAISLSAEEVEVGVNGDGAPVKRRICELYPEISKQLVCDGGYLVVTSCNWTEDELIAWFTKPSANEREEKAVLTVFDRVEYPKFRFGGREGQGVCTVCFQRTKSAA